MGRSLIQNSITSEATVRASYSSEVVGCGTGVWGGDCAPSPRKLFLYNSSVVVVGCGGGVWEVPLPNHLNAHP